MWKKLALFLLLSWTIPLGLSQTPSPNPLTDDEKRQILSQLYQLQGILLQTLPQLDSDIAKLRGAIEDQKSATRDAVEAEQRVTAAVAAERDVWKDKAQFYEASLKAVTKPCGGARKFFHYATLGIVACH